jgi:CCR4-NOT transcription complex subunit 9
LHLYVYPLINTLNKQRPYEHLRVTSLGVIGALVKGEDSSEAIKFLVKTELIVLCLRIMKKGYEMSKTVSIFIVLKILLDNLGLDYVCRTDERLNAVANILKDMMDEMEKVPSEEGKDNKMVRQIIRCFLRLSENPKFDKKSQCESQEVFAEVAVESE